MALIERAPLATHEVFNQTPPFADVNLVALDRPLLDALVDRALPAL